MLDPTEFDRKASPAPKPVAAPPINVATSPFGSTATHSQHIDRHTQNFAALVLVVFVVAVVIVATRSDSRSSSVSQAPAAASTTLAPQGASGVTSFVAPVPAPEVRTPPAPSLEERCRTGTDSVCLYSSPSTDLSGRVISINTAVAEWTSTDAGYYRLTFADSSKGYIAANQLLRFTKLPKPSVVRVITP
jgi:hypothetical protein